MNHRPSRRLIAAILLLVTLLSACRAPRPTPAKPTDTGILPAASAEAAVLPTDTPAVTPTLARSKVILLALPGGDTHQAIAVQEVLNELAAPDGLIVETRAELAGMQLEPDVRAVVALPPDPGVLNLAAANPDVPVLALGIPGIQPAANLSVLASGGDRPDRQGFIAGYLSAVLTPDWRVGVVSIPETPSDKAARSGFNNGVIFYCGLCRPSYPPFIQYPIFVDLPANAGPDVYQTAVTTLTGNAVKTVYVAPGVTDAAFLDSLAAAGLQIIGSGAPSAAAAPQWIASVSVDELEALRALWPRLLAGEDAASVDVPLALTQRSETLFSPGRQQLVERILADLLAGYIDTGIDPETGEPR